MGTNYTVYRDATFQSFFQLSSQSLVIKADSPHFTVLAVSDQYLNLVHKKREELLDKGLFEVFPGSAADPSEKFSVFSSFHRVIETGKVDELPVFKYEIFVKETGKYETHYWTNVNQQIIDEEGNVAYIINTTTNITGQVKQQQALQEGQQREQSLYEELVSANEELVSINEELNQSQQQLYELNEQLEERIIQRTSIAEAAKFRLEAMVMNTPIAMSILKGEDLVVEVANQPMLAVWRRTLDQVIGRGLVEIFPELNDQPNPVRMRGVLHSGKRFSLPETEVILGTVDGVLKKHYARFSYDPIFETDGSVGSILVTVIDITEEVVSRMNLEQSRAQLQQKTEELAALNKELTAINEELIGTQDALSKALKAVQESEEKLKIAIETGRMGTWSIDTVTLKPTLSEFVKNMLGIPLEVEVTMEMIMTAIKPEYHEMLMETLQNAVKNGQPSDTEYAIINLQTGEEKWVKATATVLLDNEGNPVEYTGIFMDITERKLDELRKNDFIGMVSHELKTPLTSLNAYLQMLQSKAKKAEDAFTSGALDQSVKQVKRMTIMINGFLNVSRLESGKINIDKQRFNMADLIKESEEETIPMYSSHQIVFAPVEETIVVADRDKIGQVVSNFISNAIKYSKPGSTVNVACVTVNGFAMVSVKDEGIGIEPKEINRLFERYYRVEGNNHISGFGIGLYLCHEIIERHHGKIWAESEPGKGSTFFFSIPILK